MIETDRLILRPCRESDKPVFADILNTPAMMQHFGGVGTREAIDALIDKRIADQEKHGMSYWAVELKTTGALIGTCGIRIASNYAGAPIFGMHEIGWRIAQAHWGQGYAREAAETSLAWAWQNTAAASIAAWTTAGNHRSLALMQRLGMKRREDLDFIDPRSADGLRQEAALVYVVERPGVSPPALP